MQLRLLIQSRINSSRFFGKALSEIKGRPLAGHLLDSVSQLIPKSDILVLTTTNPVDVSIADFCQTDGVSCFRGDEQNVASRFVEVLKQIPGCTHFVRISGDSPLMDHRVVKRCVELAERSGADLATTALTRTYPSGCNVECLKTGVFLEAYPQFSTADHFEHVTRFFYENPERFKIEELKSGIVNPQRFKFSVDTQQDLARVKHLFAAIDKPHWQYSIEEKCELAEKLGLVVS